MLFDETAARENLRTRDGRRVFYLGRGDQLTSAARDWLQRERVEILPASSAKPERYRLLSGGFLEEKPESMTSLNGGLLVPKSHPRIVFRGKMDTLEAAFLLCQGAVPECAEKLEELLSLARRALRCEVLGEALEVRKIWGMAPEELRRRSHFPQEFYGQPHFMPKASDGSAILELNRLRCLVRETELAAAAAELPDDILLTLNRLSSAVYLLMIEKKAGKGHARP